MRVGALALAKAAKIRRLPRRGGSAQSPAYDTTGSDPPPVLRLPTGQESEARLRSRVDVRRVLPILAVVLAYAMTPGALEITENALHLVIHGDSAHAEDSHAPDTDTDHAPDTDTDEHGCSGTYHACSCHRSPQVADAALWTLSPVSSVLRPGQVTAPATLKSSGFAREIDRPPQA